MGSLRERAIKTAEFDEDGDGKRDRRLTYNGAALG
jgi:hypothetical protein